MHNDLDPTGTSRRATTPVEVLGVPETIEGVLQAPVGLFLEAMKLSGANSWRYTDRLPLSGSESEEVQDFAGEAMTMMIVVGDKGALALQQLGKQMMETGLIPRIESAVPKLDSTQVTMLYRMVVAAIQHKEEQLRFERKTNDHFVADKRERVIRDEIAKLVNLLQAVKALW